MTDHVTDYLRHAGQVKRYHTWPTIQTQTVGEHSWQVALIYEQLFGELSSPVERYIRMHDVTELVVGDIPFPVKSEHEQLRKELEYIEYEALERMGVRKLPILSHHVQSRIKICDLLEMMVFGMHERELGNLLAIPIIIRTRDAAIERASLLHFEDWQMTKEFVEEAEARHNRVLKQEKVQSGNG